VISVVHEILGLEGGYHYFMTMIDWKSGYTTILLMKKKKSPLVLMYNIKDYINVNEHLTGQKLQIIRTDSGSEYLSNETLRYLKSEGTQHEATCPETPKQNVNGKAEQTNRTLVELVSSIKHTTHL
jgi:uncharacterized protein YqfB (UPF0267 family)